MLDTERSSAPQFFGLSYLHMVIEEDNKIVAFSDRVAGVKMSPCAIDRSIEILQTEIDLYIYFFYISCHFVTYGNTLVPVLPE